MRVFSRSLALVRRKWSDLVTRFPDLTPGWWPVRGGERRAGAWQRDVAVSANEMLTFSPVWACITLIASDIAKLAVNLIEEDADGIWTPTTSAAFSPVLRRPNHYQNRIQFFLSWVMSKLTRGNTYALKERDRRGNVVALYILDPSRVKPLVAPNGEVFYECSPDELASLPQAVTVPATEIIHDVMYAMFHPLCGLPPLIACALASTQGVRIQQNAAKFFANGSNPGGILTTPTPIGPEAQKQLQKDWEDNYGGEDNVGKVAVLAGGLDYKPMAQTARDSQLADQLKLSATMVCAAFHVPEYMVGFGPALLNGNAELLNQQYYSQCLQILIESLELCLDEGLRLPDDYGIEFDVDGLLRMDTATLVKTEVEGVGGGIKAPNEARKRLNLKPVPGGETPYMQEQNWPLRLLSARTLPSQRPPTPPAPMPGEELSGDDLVTKAADRLREALAA